MAILSTLCRPKKHDVVSKEGQLTEKILMKGFQSRELHKAMTGSTTVGLRKQGKKTVVSLATPPITDVLFGGKLYEGSRYVVYDFQHPRELTVEINKDRVKIKKNNGHVMDSQEALSQIFDAVSEMETDSNPFLNELMNQLSSIMDPNSIPAPMKEADAVPSLPEVNLLSEDAAPLSFTGVLLQELSTVASAPATENNAPSFMLLLQELSTAPRRIVSTPSRRSVGWLHPQVLGQYSAISIAMP